MPSSYRKKTASGGRTPKAAVVAVREALAATQGAASKNGHKAHMPKEGIIAMTVTPEMAADWMAGNLHNRQLRDYRVMKLANEIGHDRWMPYNGETIKFSADGELLDGQHRLCAVIVANVAIETYVAFGVPKLAFRTIDTGLRRTIKDALFLTGEGNTVALSHSLNAMYRYLNTGQFYYHAAQPSNEELMLVLETCPTLRESADLALKLKAKLPGVQVGPVAVLHYLFTEKDAEDAAWFFESLKTGVGLAADSPIYVLREKLVRPLERRQGTQFRMQQETAIYVVKCWNAYREDRPLTARLLRVYEDEKLPLIV